jgi:GH35 family endo-1,4-beta-xylanase
VSEVAIIELDINGGSSSHDITAAKACVAASACMYRNYRKSTFDIYFSLGFPALHSRAHVIAELRCERQGLLAFLVHATPLDSNYKVKPAYTVVINALA